MRAQYLCLFLALGCTDKCSTDSIEPPLFSGEFDAPSYEGLESLDLPPGPEGRGFTYSPAVSGTLWVDTELRDSVTAAGACAALIVACVSPEERNIHGCLLNTATCETDTPWNEEPCCPSTCLEAYRERRENGLEEIPAFSQAIFSVDGCIPGLAEIVGGEE